MKFIITEPGASTDNSSKQRSINSRDAGSRSSGSRFLKKERFGFDLGRTRILAISTTSTSLSGASGPAKVDDTLIR